MFGGSVGSVAGATLKQGVSVGKTPDGQPLIVSTPAGAQGLIQGGSGLAGIPTRYILIGAAIIAVLVVVKK